MGAGRRRRYLESADDCHVTTETQLEEEERGRERGGSRVLFMDRREGRLLLKPQEGSSWIGKTKISSFPFYMPLVHTWVSGAYYMVIENCLLIPAF